LGWGWPKENFIRIRIREFLKSEGVTDNEINDSEKIKRHLENEARVEVTEQENNAKERRRKVFSKDKEKRMQIIPNR